MNQVTSASLRYPLSVFNKNSTLETRGRRPISDKIEKTEGKHGLEIGRACGQTDQIWSAAAPGLKPLHLRRARSPGMGEGGYSWSRPMGVIAEGIPRGCQGEQSNPLVLGIPSISFQ